MQGRYPTTIPALALASIFIMSVFCAAVAAESVDHKGLAQPSNIPVGPIPSKGKDDGTMAGPDYRGQAPPWPQPELPQRFGDEFTKRAVFVHQDDSTYLDDLLYCSAIPATVHWEGGTRHDSLLISDEEIRENGNLLGDWLAYLEKTGAEPTIDFIGDVDPTRQATLTSFFNNVKASNEVTNPANVYDGACDIADYYWHFQRSQTGPDTAVLAYVPDPDGVDSEIAELRRILAAAPI